VCIRWSNLVVVANCDRNFHDLLWCLPITVVTSLGIKRKHVLYFLGIAENPKLTFMHFVPL
jgi:hypothetical protein